MTNQLDAEKYLGTITIDEAIQRDWHVVIVGAGVSGAAFAIHAARGGWRVLLVEAATFPREKVCGGCLNQRAIRSLEKLGVLENLKEAGAVTIRTLKTCTRRHTSKWQISTMLSARRSTIDALLVGQAIESGACFLQNTRASVNSLPNRPTVELALANGSMINKPKIEADCVVVAAGLARSAIVREKIWKSSVAADSRIGAHCLIPQADQGLLSAVNLLMQDDALLMMMGKHGYVGICLTDGAWIDMAAAIDPKAIKRHGTIGKCIEAIFEDCGVRVDVDLNTYTWKSTPLLTRQSERVAYGSVFLLGDSLGYVEPFTGEGMSWGLSGAERLASILQPTLSDSHVDRDAMATARQAWSNWVGQHRRTHYRLAQWVARRSRNIDHVARCLTFLDWMAPLRSWMIRKAMR